MSRKHILIHCCIVGGVLLLSGLLWALKRLDFYEPVWLLGLLALPFVIWQAARGISGLPAVVNVTSATVRSLLLALLFFCLADIQYVQHNERICVLYLLDRSASIPESVYQQQLAYVNESAKRHGRKDSSGIVVFGEDASVEVVPQHNLEVDRLHSAISTEYTDLQQAIELATAVFPEDARKKIVLISDGNENIGDVLKGAEYAAANQVQMDVVAVRYDYPNEIAVEKVHVPDQVKEGEPFDLRVHVNSTVETTAKMTIYKNGEVISSERIPLKPGANVRTPRVQLDSTGVHGYEVVVEAETPGTDTIRQNNRSEGYVYIKGQSKVLFIASSQAEVKYLLDACAEESLEAELRQPENAFSSIQELQPYDCVVLANVPSQKFNDRQMENLRLSVRNAGVGLIMIGGSDSFGAGDWNNTPVEEALPVTMDIRQKKINPKGALVLILHTCEFENGNYWAKEISKEAIRHVNPQDEVGLIYYGYGGGNSGDQWLFPLEPAENKAMMFNRIAKCEPGDMPSFAPAFTLAVQGLKQSDAMVKHVIVISDGDPAAPRTADIKEMANLGITVSTVGINPHSQRDVDILKLIAYDTGGRYYFAKDPKVLPRIFVKEAKVVKRSLIFSQEFIPVLTTPSELTKGIRPGAMPSLQAYVATTPKDLAAVPLVSANENQDPILAHWQYGLGRSVAFTSDATNNWAVNWVQWSHFKKFWGQTIRWASRKSDGSSVDIRTEIEGRTVKVIVDAIDENGEYINNLTMGGNSTDGQDSVPLNFRQVAPGQWIATYEAGGEGANLITVRYEGPEGSGTNHSGVVIPYSPEYRVKNTNDALLKRAAELTGGVKLDGDPSTDPVWNTVLAPFQSSQGVWEKLLILILVLLMLDVVLRRVIFTMADLRGVWQTVLLRLPGQRSTEKDETMSALLARKKQVAERHRGGQTEAPAPGQVAPPTLAKEAKARIEASDDFRARLQERAKSAGDAPLDIASSGAPGTRAPGDAATPDAGAADADSYTNRLLKAKRRARKDEERDDA